MTIRALVFDAYGTLYDVQSVRSLATDLCGDKGEIITHLWRLKQLEYTWLRTLMRSYEDFWSVTRAALEFTLTSLGIDPAPSICDQLMTQYLHLHLYAEAEEALESLRDHKLAILSNGSPGMLEALVSSSGDRRTPHRSDQRRSGEGCISRNPPVTRSWNRPYGSRRKRCCSSRRTASM